MNDDLVFSSVDLIEVPVTIDGKKYTLREMSLATGIKLRNAHTEAAIIKDGKVVGTKGVAHMEPQIISECLFDDKGKNVPMADILKWGDRIASKLYTKLRQISGYDTKRDVVKLEAELADARKAEAAQGNS